MIDRGLEREIAKSEIKERNSGLKRLIKDCENKKTKKKTLVEIEFFKKK